LLNQGGHYDSYDGLKEEQMKKIMGLGAMLLAGLLVIPGNLGLAGQVLAQSDTQTDKQLQELRQKRQEQWEEREREAKQLENTGQRKQDAVKRQQDAGQRQKAAEQRLRELDEEDK
jgi:phosphatidate phosphatase PAH1